MNTEIIVAVAAAASAVAVVASAVWVVARINTAVESIREQINRLWTTIDQIRREIWSRSDHGQFRSEVEKRLDDHETRLRSGGL